MIERSITSGSASGTSVRSATSSHAVDGRLSAIGRAPEGGGSLLDTILGEVQAEMAGRLQPDDLTLLTATVVGPMRRSGPRIVSP